MTRGSCSVAGRAEGDVNADPQHPQPDQVPYDHGIDAEVLPEIDAGTDHERADVHVDADAERTADAGVIERARRLDHRELSHRVQLDRMITAARVSVDAGHRQEALEEDVPISISKARQLEAARVAEID